MSTAALQEGDRLGPYQILSQVGAGGMGEVWRARDTRLDRIVAIKTSKEEFSERFEHEAHAVAALNHPHICQVYDVGALPSGASYLVMEFIEGTPLKGPLPFDLALKLAIQIADALHAAHRRGIVHRDLKPGNILVTKTGVKILDFGLAKINQPGPLRAKAGLPPEEVPTEEMWEEGVVAGTLHYMAPEQLQGKPTDGRCDIFSLGVLLYEMTGECPYKADNAASLIAEVLKGPPLSVMSLKPPALARVASRCLAADPDERWQSAHDLQMNLEWIALGLPESEPAPAKAAVPRKWWIAAAAALVSVGALAALVGYRVRPGAAAPVVSLSLLPPEGASFVAGSSGGPPALSPDGRMIAFAAEQNGQQMLWVRPLDSPLARVLPGTEGARSPFWAPSDSAAPRHLAFFSQDKLKRIDIDGGTPQTLASVPGGFQASGAWGPNDRILYAPSNLLGLFAIPAGGGTPAAATKLEAGEVGHFWPSFLPDGTHFLFSRIPAAQVFAGTIGSFSRETLLAGASRAEYVPGRGTSYLVYSRENTLFAQPFDAARRQLKEEPRRIAENVGASDFSAVPGVLAFRAGVVAGPELVTYDRSGRKTGSLGRQAGPVGTLRFSPDGKTLAIVRNTGRTTDIWLEDLTRGVSSRFTFNGGNNPVWSPDGKTLLYRKADGLYIKAADGTGGEEEIYSSERDPGLRNATDWSADGRFVLIARTDPNTGFDMWLLPDPAGKGKAGNKDEHRLAPLLASPANEGQGRFSRPGAPRWVAYSSEESGVNEVYVMTMPGGPPGKWQISNGGGYAPRWSNDGREIFYIGPDLRTVMSVAIEPGEVFRPGAPRELFKLPVAMNSAVTDQGFAISPDGKTFVFALPGQESSISSITVVLGWEGEMRE
jgi:Tol biopolymer transport system component/predicted Ser/Thr protein kinase